MDRLLAGTIARVSNELYSLKRTEIGEVLEGRDAGDVGSSTMPQKTNPSHTEFSVAAPRLASPWARYLSDWRTWSRRTSATCANGWWSGKSALNNSCLFLGRSTTSSRP
ncbi:lyase family protein [Glaciibacter superstes]|uniref:lyase family protein n=1 Tax=Glaciibacter superstes TaxID=501023 RepID=UPI00146F0170